jgi:hypothetical protein
MNRSDNRESIDRLTLGTVNASVSSPATAAELAGWLLDGRLAFDGRALLSLETFLLEVPLETQVLFLANHHVTEDQALTIARKIGLRADIPLAKKHQW